MRAKTLLLFATIVVCFTFSFSCSSGPKGPEKGSPEFYWNAAKETYSAGDYLKTLENLDRAMKSDEYKAQGLPWALVLTAGLAHGYMDYADAFETGVRVNKTNPAAFRRNMSNLRRNARGLSLQFYERVQKFVASNKDAEVKLVFPFPAGTQAESAVVSRLGKGILPNDAEIEQTEKYVLQQALQVDAARFSGAGDDVNKASMSFKAGDVKVSRADFVTAIAGSMHDQAMLFGQKKLDEPDKMNMILAQAATVLKDVPSNKAVKDLSTKIEKAQKAAATKKG